jgi:membrane protein implicated in regulation of membrane protease activity
MTFLKNLGEAFLRVAFITLIVGFFFFVALFFVGVFVGFVWVSWDEAPIPTAVVTLAICVVAFCVVLALMWEEWKKVRKQRARRKELEMAQRRDKLMNFIEASKARGYITDEDIEELMK